MSFRNRITLVATVAVALAVLLASALTYWLVSDQLHRQIDSSLRDTAFGLQRGISGLRHGGRPVALALPAGMTAARLAQILKLGPLPPRGRFDRLLLRTPGSALGQDRGVLQLLGAGGNVLAGPGGSGGGQLPVGPHARILASTGGASYFFSQTSIGSNHLRVLTAALPPGTPARAVQIARSLNETDHTLYNLRLLLSLVALGGIALAALLGQLVSRAAVAPIRRLTSATEHVASTRDLARRIPAGGSDELGRLAVSFNAMLDALERSVSALDDSVRAQRQLVADASHELRTPITSLRANIEVLQQAQALSEHERERLLSDVVEQLEDLTTLVGDVIELARGEAQQPACEDVRLDQVAAEAIERARRHVPGAEIESALEPTLVVGDPQRLDHAVRNLLDNAIKFSPRDSPVEVRLEGGELTVRDHGPGIPAEESEHVFDRFYRAQSARALPGSGLGLAIVRQVAEAHGGSVSAEQAPGGGALMRLRIPTVALGEATEPRAALHTG
jgi:two-component system, OmpR family, sensor histidine kinase MprB